MDSLERENLESTMTQLRRQIDRIYCRHLVSDQGDADMVSAGETKPPGKPRTKKHDPLTGKMQVASMVSLAELEMFKTVAADAKMSVSEWVRSTLLPIAMVRYKELLPPEDK